MAAAPGPVRQPSSCLSVGTCWRASCKAPGSPMDGATTIGGRWRWRTCLTAACMWPIWGFSGVAPGHDRCWPARPACRQALLCQSLSTQDGLAHRGGSSHPVARHSATAGGRAAGDGGVAGSARTSAGAAAHRTGTQGSGRRAPARIRQHAQDQGRQPDEEVLYLAGWTIVLTNVPRRRLSAEQVLVILRLRSQIERLFRLWKEHGHLDEWRSKKPWRYPV